MAIFIAQCGEYCLLTLDGYIAVTEAPGYLPAGQAAWLPDDEHIVGYAAGQPVYRLLSQADWNAVLQAHRQRQVNRILDQLRQRGLYGGPAVSGPANEASASS